MFHFIVFRNCFEIAGISHRDSCLKTIIGNSTAKKQKERRFLRLFVHPPLW